MSVQQTAQNIMQQLNIDDIDQEVRDLEAKAPVHPKDTKKAQKARAERAKRAEESEYDDEMVIDFNDGWSQNFDADAFDQNFDDNGNKIIQNWQDWKNWVKLPGLCKDILRNAENTRIQTLSDQLKLVYCFEDKVTQLAKEKAHLRAEVKQAKGEINKTLEAVGRGKKTENAKTSTHDSSFFEKADRDLAKTPTDQQEVRDLEAKALVHPKDTKEAQKKRAERAKRAQEKENEDDLMIDWSGDLSQDSPFENFDANNNKIITNWQDWNNWVKMPGQCKKILSNAANTPIETSSDRLNLVYCFEDKVAKLAETNAQLRAAAKQETKKTPEAAKEKTKTSAAFEMQNVLAAAIGAFMIVML